jgi:hypothetical protein
MSDQLDQLQRRIDGLEGLLRSQNVLLNSFNIASAARDSRINAAYQLMMEMAEKLGCPPQRFLRLADEWTKWHHQQVLEAMEREDSLVAALADDRCAEEVATDEPQERLFPD